MTVLLGTAAARIDAEDAHDQDAELQEDEGGCRDDHHRPASAKDVVGVELALHKNWKEKVFRGVFINFTFNTSRVSGCLKVWILSELLYFRSGLNPDLLLQRSVVDEDFLPKISIVHELLSQTAG